MERLSAPERTREELRALMNGDLGTWAGRSDLVRVALRLIVDEVLEGEMADMPGRERYDRAGDGEKAGYRNGYRLGKVKTAEGAVDYSAPQVRDTPEPVSSPAYGPRYRGARGSLSGWRSNFTRPAQRDRRGRTQIAAGVDGRLEGGCSRRPVRAAFQDLRRQRARGPAARGQRRDVGDPPGDRGNVSPIGAPALPRAPDA